MGNEVSREEKQEKNILRSPNIGQASDLYWASRAGDVEAVRQILAPTNFTDLNHLEPNGSTALHAASFFGHVDVVRLLLQQHGVIRHRKNRHGLTAYEEAANEEIRQLFHRPNSTRFCNDSINDNGNIFDFTTEQQLEDDEDNDEAPNDWVERFKEELDVRVQKAEVQVYKTMVSSPLLRRMVKHALRDTDDSEGVTSVKTAIIAMQKVIDEYVTSAHPEYIKACELLSKYAKTNKVEHLLRLYSLETPFYRSVGNYGDNGCLLLPLMFQLDSLKTRAFHGRTYRGLTMTAEDFRGYRWALKNKGSIIKTQSFCSTSVDEAVARQFMSTSCSEKLSVLMIFNFAKPCDMAIQLYALSEKLPCISDFENEREVLLLPDTIFHVTSIVNDDSSGQSTIYLENVLPKMDWTASWTYLKNGMAKD